MLRKFLIPTVIVSILLLLTTLITLAKTETTSVVTSTPPAVTKAKPTTTTTTARPFIVLATSVADSSVTTVIHQSRGNEKLLNNAEETTTSLLPLQPPLNVTSTTLASFILNQQQHKQKQQQQERQRKKQPPPQANQTRNQTQPQHHQHQRHQQQKKVRQQQQQQRQQQQHQQQLQQRQHRQPKQDVGETQQSQKHLITAPSGNDSKENLKKNPEEVSARVELITPVPTSTHAYIPFDLDYSDPTEEKSRPPEDTKQTTINEVLSNLFPKGFSDIFRFSYAADPEIEEDTADAATARITTTPRPTQMSITVIKSTPMPFKPMPTEDNNKKSNVTITETPIAFIPMPIEKLKADEEDPNTNDNATILATFTTMTRESRRETSPGHVEIVVEKFINDATVSKSMEDFRDGSNAISKEELLRINRAAKEASVLPSLLVNPEDEATSNQTTKANPNGPIVILNENSNDDFVDAPQDDNQIAESQNFVQGVYQKPPPAESISYQQGQNHEINVHIIHDNNLRSVQDEALQRRNHKPQVEEQPQHLQSYQSFVDQAKQIQNSLQETPSRKFLKNFNPTLSESSNPSPVPKGNFHYEQTPESHIQTVPPAAQLQYVRIEMPPQQQRQPEYQPQYKSQHEMSNLHTSISGDTNFSDKDAYQTIGSDDDSEPETATPFNLIFVTINTPQGPQEISHDRPYQQPSPAPLLGPSKPQKTPQEYVYNAVNGQPEPIPDHQPEETENSPKPSGGEGGGGYTFVEVQKSINIHNKLITEKDGRLIEQHETIYPEQEYGERLEPKQLPQQEQQIAHDYLSLSQNPIHVIQLDENAELYEPAASLKEEQHALDPSQSLVDIGPIQQSNLVQESHIIETPGQHGAEYIQDETQQYHQAEHHHEGHLTEEYQHAQPHLQTEASHNHHPPPVHVPYALPPDHFHHQQPHHHHQHPLILQEVIEKHVHIPYAVPEPIPYPVHVQHFIDRPVPVETIVEKPMPYQVEKIVEKVVEKHVPVEVERIVEKPVETIIEKYIDRPVAIPIKIPVALHMPNHNPTYSTQPGHYPLTYGGSGYSNVLPWSQSPTLTRIPTKILQSYYTKMLKKLVPQMTQAYKTSPLNSKPKTVPKYTAKPATKQTPKIRDMRYDLKPPPPPPLGPSWDVGARYQYDYNTLPLDLSASSSTAVGKQAERPVSAPGYKTKFDEFQRWRNGHSLKRSPEFGMNLHMEYGFKPPLVPSVEIDDKGIPLRAAADLTKGKEERK